MLTKETLTLCKNSPKTVFIMGGGEGSTVREILKHRRVNKVVMCDIDEVLKDLTKVSIKEKCWNMNFTSTLCYWTFKYSSLDG